MYITVIESGVLWKLINEISVDEGGAGILNSGDGSGSNSFVIKWSLKKGCTLIRIVSSFFAVLLLALSSSPDVTKCLEDIKDVIKLFPKKEHCFNTTNILV